MKKIVVIVFLLLFFMLPINVGATELTPKIEYAWITGTNVKTVGEELSLGFGVKLSGIQKGNADSMGMLVVSFELMFDDTVFTVTGIESSDWDSVVASEDGSYYVVSQVADRNPYQNKCIDGITFCADYYVTIKFFVNDTDKTSSDIKMGELAVGLSEMIDPNKEYTEDDIYLLTENANKSYTININKGDTPVTEKPSSIVSDTKPEISNKEILSKTQESATVQKSSNNYLKSLQIENYEINFDKTKNDYEITVAKDINELNLKVELEDSKATYKVIGADNLEKNNNKVLVEVTAENGDKNTYTINIKREEDSNAIIEDEVTSKKKKTFKLKKKHIIIASVIGGIALLLVIIIKMVIHKKDRKLEKALDEL